MLRLRGDRQSLLVALTVHWLDHQVGIPPSRVTTEVQPAVSPSALSFSVAARREMRAGAGSDA